MDPEAVLATLLDDDGLGYADGPTYLDAGRSADLYTFRLDRGPDDLTGRELILRVLPASARSLDEAVIQQRLAELGYPMPRVLRHGPLLDRPGAVVMERVAGAELFEALGVRRALRDTPDVLAELLLRLHAIDPASVLPQGSDLTDRVLHDLDDLDDPWFADHRPPPEPLVVCHGDLHAFNVLVDGDRQTVLDWEIAGVAPRAYDVSRSAVILATVPMAMPRPVRPLVERVGRRSARRLEAAYTASCPIAEATLRWYEALHCARVLALLAGATESQGVLDGWRPAEPALRRRLQNRWRPR